MMFFVFRILLIQKNTWLFPHIFLWLLTVSIRDAVRETERFRVLFENLVSHQFGSDLFTPLRLNFLIQDFGTDRELVFSDISKYLFVCSFFCYLESSCGSRQAKHFSKGSGDGVRIRCLSIGNKRSRGSSNCHCIFLVPTNFLLTESNQFPLSLRLSGLSLLSSFFWVGSLLFAVALLFGYTRAWFCFVLGPLYFHSGFATALCTAQCTSSKLHHG